MLLEKADESTLAMLWVHYEPEPALLQTCKTMAFQTLVSSYAQIESKLVELFDDNPFLLMQGFFKSLDVRRTVCERFRSCHECCLETRCSRQLSNLWSSAAEMAADEDFGTLFI